MCMPHDLLFHTSRFNLSEQKEHFINPCCFGEDLAAWLRGKLIERGLAVIEPGQEDWGWYIEARHEGSSYFIAIGGNSDEDSADKNRGEWRIGIDKHRSFWEKLTGKNKLADNDPVLHLVQSILQKENDFSNIHRE